MVETYTNTLRYSTKHHKYLFRSFLLLTIVLFSYLSSYLPQTAHNQELLKGQALGEIAKVLPVKKEQKKVAKASQITELAIDYKKAEPTIPKGKNSEENVFGVATQIGEHTWTMTVAADSKIGSATEIFSALNVYRERHGRSKLLWDDNLGNFAKSRADNFAAKGGTDTHAGFTDYVNNQDGFKKLKFMTLGENSSFGYHLEAVHLIEWVYAGDEPHNNNQLSSDWTHVGIGVNGRATDLIFGGRRM